MWTFSNINHGMEHISNCVLFQNVSLYLQFWIMCSKTSNLGHIVQLGLGHSLTLLTLCILFKTVFFIETMNPIFQMFSFWAASCLNIWFCAYVHFVCMFVSNVCLICHRCFKSTSKQGRRLRFGMLTVLTNIKSTKLLW